MNLRPNWQADCPQCVASKLTCDKHYQPQPVREYRNKSGCQYCDGYCHGGCREGDYA